MDASLNTSLRSKVQAFLRKHRIGLLTLLFTDIVGSTKLKQTLGDAAAVMHIKQHHDLLRNLLTEFAEAEEISTAGDSFFVVFARPSDALRFGLFLQSRLRALSKESGVPLLDRVGIHVGEVVIDENHFGEGGKDLYGIQVDNCARIMSLADGDQILMSRVVFDNARQVLRGQEITGLEELSWLNHGAYTMKGIEEPVEVCEVGERGKAVLTPPGDSEKARRCMLASGELVPGWRPALDQLVPKTKWILEEKLGEGGFGEVWLCRHETFKQRRVFKFCFRADRVRSLKREVTLFRVMKERLGSHPNIAGIQDVYFDEPPFYVVMEYAPGKDLKAWCAARGGIDKVSMPIRLEIVAQVADALNAAHRAGVIHRDIKPGNILVNLDEHVSSSGITVKLTDFGIGQVVSEEALAGVTSAGFTETIASSGSSAHAGTHIYMAPELSVGERASAMTDIYSLGVVLYQLLIGDWSRPLTMDWQNEIGDKLLRRILTRCFAGNPVERYTSCETLAEDIRSLEQRWVLEARVKCGLNAGLTVILGLLLLCPPLGLLIAQSSFDLTFAVRRSPVPQEAVIVSMDEASHAGLQQPLNSPWDRALHAKLLDRLKADNASAAVFDIVFSDPRTDKPQSDQEFSRAIKSFGKVILASDSTRAGQKILSVPPYHGFAEVAAGIGDANFSVDRDTTIRWLDDDERAPLLQLSMAAASVVHPGKTNSASPTTGRRWLNYYGPPGTIARFSFHKALDTNVIPAGTFKDKVVFIGATTMREGPSFDDAYRSPIATKANRFVSGVEVHATAFLNLLHDETLTRLPFWLELGLTTVFGCVLGFGFGYARTSICLLLALCSVFCVLVAVWVLQGHHLWSVWIIPLIQIAFSLGWTIFTSRFGQLCYEKRADGTLVGYVFRFKRQPKGSYRKSASSRGV